MDTTRPELPVTQAAPALVRCADLPRALAGADAKAVGRASSSLAAQLKQLGWQEISNTEGSRTYASEGRMLAVDQLIGMIAGGYMSASNWEATCAADGISELMVPAPQAVEPAAKASVEASPAPGGYQDPFAVAATNLSLTHRPGGTQSLSKRLATWVAIAVFIVGTGYIRIHRAMTINDHMANHRGTENEVEVKYDGLLVTGGGRVTSKYAKQKHEFESVSPPATDSEFPDIAAIETDGVSRWTSGGRDFINISHSVQRENLSDAQARKQWINARNAVATGNQGSLVTAKRTTLAGAPAWSWEWSCRDGCWNYAVRSPRGKDVYSVRCRLTPVNNTPANRARCKQVAADMKVNGVGS